MLIVVLFKNQNKSHFLPKSQFFHKQQQIEISGLVVSGFVKTCDEHVRCVQNRVGRGPDDRRVKLASQLGLGNTRHTEK